MSNEVNQAYLRAYIKSRAEGAPVHARQSAPGNASANEAIRKPVTQRIDAGTQQMPGPSMPIPPRRAPVTPSQKEVLRNETAKTIQEPQQSTVWSPLGVERGVKATGIFRSQPAVIVNGAASTRDTSQDSDTSAQFHRAKAESISIASAKHPSQSATDKRSTSNPAGETRIRIDRAHMAPVDRSASRVNRTTPHVDRSTSIGPADTTTTQYQTTQHQPFVDVSDRAAMGHYESRHAASQEAFRPADPYVPSVAPYTQSESTTEPLVFPTATQTPALQFTAAPMPRPLPQSQNRRFDPTPTPVANPKPPVPKAPVAQTPVAQAPVAQAPVAQAPVAQAPVVQTRTSESRLPLPLPVKFVPSWEVDRFFWPEVAIHIEKSHGDAFHQIGKHLRIANQEGLRVMAITSGERGVGRSTVAMHLARSAAAAGLNVALVDTDTFYPSLVDQLRLDVEHGWQDCLFENVPLEETAVRSIEDRITVFPLTSTISSQQMHANLHRMSKIVKRISSAFDLVLLDSNRLNLEQRDLVGVSQESIVDAAIVVVDTELSIKEKVDTAVSILQGMGIASIGMVENFNG